MERRQIIEHLVTEIAPNATVAGFEERAGRCVVAVVGTTGVIATCELPPDAVDAAERGGPERDHVTATLKRCTDDVVAPMPDGRG